MNPRIQEKCSWEKIFLPALVVFAVVQRSRAGKFTQTPACREISLKSFCQMPLPCSFTRTVYDISWPSSRGLNASCRNVVGRSSFLRVKLVLVPWMTWCLNISSCMRRLLNLLLVLLTCVLCSVTAETKLLQVFYFIFNTYLYQSKLKPKRIPPL